MFSIKSPSLIFLFPHICIYFLAHKLPFGTNGIFVFRSFTNANWALFVLVLGSKIFPLLAFQCVFSCRAPTQTRIGCSLFYIPFSGLLASNARKAAAFFYRSLRDTIKKLNRKPASRSDCISHQHYVLKAKFNKSFLAR